jgi:E3 ubiquitin ligase
VHLSALFIRSSDSDGLSFWCVAGVAAGLYLFYRGFLLLQRRRLILDTPFSKIRSASLGVIELSGLAVGPYTMAAPITSRACYYYRTLVWELKREGKNSKWVKVAGECMHLPFFVDDNTGRVLVDPRQAELDLHCDFQQQFSDSFFTMNEPAPANVRSFLARHGIATSNKIKVEEYCIKPKNALFILGTLAENRDIEVSAKAVPDSDYHSSGISLGQLSVSMGGGVLSTMFEGADEESRFAAAMGGTGSAPGQEVIRLPTPTSPAQSAEMSQQQKIAAAMRKAGITNPAAWAAAGLSGPGLSNPGLSNPGIGNPLSGNVAAPDGASATEAFDTHPPVVVTKGTNNKAFMISWRSQRDVARSLGWKCALMIWGGPAISLLSLYVLLGILKLR